MNNCQRLRGHRIEEGLGHVAAGQPKMAGMRNRYNRLLTSDIEQSIKTKAVSSLYTVEAVTLPVATPSLWPVLKRLRDLAQRRAAERCELCRDLDNAIARRDGEFIPCRGFMEIRERDGPGSVPRDARNRLGRPKRSW
jgi:hypothetical protein